MKRDDAFIFVRALKDVLRQAFLDIRTELQVSIEQQRQWTKEQLKDIRLVGPQGEPGPAGERGLDGIPGPAGPQGIPGLRGEDGHPGIAGERGADGAIGPAGPAGPQGIQGEIGPPGMHGERGEKGADGPPGAMGRQGDEGPVGPPGPKGDIGPIGIPGEHGNDGLPGMHGRDGKDGKDGRDGRDGLMGPIGPAGRDALEIDFLPNLEPERTYSPRTYVLANGGVIRSIRETKGNDLAGWQTIWNGMASAPSFAIIGERQLQVRQAMTDGTVQIQEFLLPIPIYRGIWESREYDEFEEVTWAGSIWIARRKTSEVPGKNGDWQLAVKHGPPGKEGKRGDKGDKGERGDQGLPGRDWR